MPVTIEMIQTKLTALGYLDPPADGVFGAVSTWALGAALNEEDPELKPDNIDNYMAKLNALQPLPLKIENNLQGKVLTAMMNEGYFIARHPGCFNIIYVEGIDTDGDPNDNVPNHFNDVRMVVRVVNGAPTIVGGPWEATTEPSRHWTINPMNEDGAFHIAFGQQKAWVYGEYHDDPALIQISPINGTRDPNKTFRRDPRHPVRGVFGVHHHGGYNLPHDEMGRSSAGCLVGRMTDNHLRFMSMVRLDVRHRVTSSYKYMATVLPQSVVKTTALVS